MRPITILVFAQWLLIGCNARDNAVVPPTPTNTVPQVQEVVLYLSGMNHRLKIL